MRILFLLVTTLLASNAWAWSSNCDHEREIEKELEIGDLMNIRVQAGAGSLDIVGKEDISKITVVAKMCASDKDILQKMDVLTEIEGKEALVETRIPKNWGGNYSAAIDLEITLPSRSNLEVADSSGDMEIERVANLVVSDSSGGIEISDVPGSLDLTDSSGGIQLRNIGSVELVDSSGEIDARGIASDFTVNVDSSGEIDVRGVGGNVLIKVDSSGSINVEDVSGNFTVQKDGSGGIRYSDVKGEVSIPRRKM